MKYEYTFESILILINVLFFIHQLLGEDSSPQIGVVTHRRACDVNHQVTTDTSAIFIL